MKLRVLRYFLFVPVKTTPTSHLKAAAPLGMHAARMHL